MSLNIYHNKKRVQETLKILINLLHIMYQVLKELLCSGVDKVTFELPVNKIKKKASCGTKLKELFDFQCVKFTTSPPRIIISSTYIR
jgi:hypothetical protein